jgi:hypothetical protein
LERILERRDLGSMQGISIAENSTSFVLLVDKNHYSREHVSNALKWLRQTEEQDTSHLGEIDPEEQAEIESLLRSMSSEDRETGFIHDVTL